MDHSNRSPVFFFRRSVFFLLFWSAGVASVSPAVSATDPTAEAVSNGVTEPKAFRRSLRFTTSYLNTFLNPFPPLSTSSIGPHLTYEFIVSPEVSVGLFFAYRPFLSNPGWSWLGYGVVLKDFLWDWVRRKAFGIEQPGRLRPYFEYGLQVASIRVSGREHYAIAHDTKLALGLEWQLAPQSRWFLVSDVAYHLSWLRYFNTESTNLMAAEINMGLRVAW